MTVKNIWKTFDSEDGQQFLADQRHRAVKLNSNVKCPVAGISTGRYPPLIRLKFWGKKFLKQLPRANARQSALYIMHIVEMPVFTSQRSCTLWVDACGQTAHSKFITLPLFAATLYATPSSFLKPSAAAKVVLKWSSNKSQAASFIALALLALDLVQQFVEVALEQSVLHDAVFFKFAFGVRLRQLCGDFACVLQNFPVGRFDKAVEAGFPILHGHGDFAQCHVLGNIEVGGYESA